MFQAISSSGLKSADAAIVAGPCRLMGIKLNPAAADSTLVVYDNASAASGTAVAKASLKANAKGEVEWFGPQGIECRNGIYADVTGASAEYIVYYALA